MILGGGQEELELVEEVEKVLSMDSLHRLTPSQKKAVNTLRGTERIHVNLQFNSYILHCPGYCLARPNALPRFLQAVNYADHLSVKVKRFPCVYAQTKKLKLQLFSGDALALRVLPPANGG